MDTKSNMALAIALNHSTLDELQLLRKENKQLKKQIKTIHSNINKFYKKTECVECVVSIANELVEEQDEEALQNIWDRVEDEYQPIAKTFYEENKVKIEENVNGGLEDIICIGEDSKLCVLSFLKKNNVLDCECERCVDTYVKYNCNPFLPSINAKYKPTIEFEEFELDKEKIRIYDFYMRLFGKNNDGNTIQIINGITKEQLINDKNKSIAKLIREEFHLNVYDVYTQLFLSYELLKHDDCELFKPKFMYKDKQISEIVVNKFISNILNPLIIEYGLDPIEPLQTYIEEQRGKMEYNRFGMYY